MSLFQLSGFQDSGVPHWSVAFIEARDDAAARRILLTILRDPDERPETVWGWDDAVDEPYQDPGNWRCTKVEGPTKFSFVLGGGCR